ncbi:PEP-CTERM sorting domain-containing protein [Limnofasciculus baicalensis]|uniref:PEP-CTERM sorting domain-containing protein n=1 Tax=Limnofasciculus baicalensis BBK-W-15 TaxID=2699891 RepID=A0AAE3GPB5_9CYAN|nr:PEP-CTERM sorting domain-containing protein [Limnofasciculus baicalensis]MCP2728195.1 PEP-CTERM sorting domain-containing protein [Limnofasciculus baicalensis BBK-W-15]
MRSNSTFLKKLSIAAGAALMAVSATGAAQAATVSFSADGLDSGLNVLLTRNNFFGVSFDAAPVGTFINSVVFDLSPDANAAFDITPAFMSTGGIGFDFGFGNTSSGLSAGDITRTVSANNKQLTLTFASGAFAVGDLLRFGIDTDGVGPSVSGSDLFDTGADFGRAAVNVSANLSNGTSGSSTFSIASILVPSRSTATVNITDPVPVPEPASVLGLLAVGALGATSKLKRKKN